MREWEGSGVDALRLTYRAGESLGGLDLCEELGGLIDAVGLNGGATPRNRGFHGFEHGVSFEAGLSIDWTDRQGSGPNVGYASVEAKGQFFSALNAEESALALLLLNDLRPKACTRIDLQQTHCDTLMVPELIHRYRQGLLKTRQKKHFEAKGAELAQGQYPRGATLCHGSRKSENYARQYDKHLEELEKGSPDPGPPRRRDEIELKSLTAQGAWDMLVAELTVEADTPGANFLAEARLAKSLIRHHLPIRDISQWSGGTLPVNWASTAPEPAWWAKHFSEDAVRARRKRGPSSTLLKRIGYMHRNQGGTYAQELVLKTMEGLDYYEDLPTASDWAQCYVRDRMLHCASDRKLQELLDNLPADKQELAEELWNSYVRAAADGDDNERSEGQK